MRMVESGQPAGGGPLQALGDAAAEMPPAPHMGPDPAPGFNAAAPSAGSLTLANLPPAPLAPAGGLAPNNQRPERNVLAELGPAEIQGRSAHGLGAGHAGGDGSVGLGASAVLVNAALAPLRNAPLERPVDRAWLDAREVALVAVRNDYEAARERAMARPAIDTPGWTVVAAAPDGGAQASGPTLHFIADPLPDAPTWTPRNTDGAPPPGRWISFNEGSFAAHYRAEAGAPLQALAARYGTDASTLLQQHPGLWDIATRDHALNAGPAPAGQAMGDAVRIGLLDLYLADPQIAGLVDAYGSSPAPATSSIALEQVRLYGQARYEQLTRLATAMQTVRDSYSQAMRSAMDGDGPGWREVPRSVATMDEVGALSFQPALVVDGDGRPMLDAAGRPQPLTDRVFDPDVFTAWYAAQDGLAARAFSDFYGASHTTYAVDDSGHSYAESVRFDNPGWFMFGAADGLRKDPWVGIDPNNPTRLNDESAVDFDLEAGWVTPAGNFHQAHDWLETVVPLALVAMVATVSGGTLGDAAANAVGAGTAAGAAASAAVVGATAATVSGVLSDNLTLKGVLQGALAGALTAGLTTGLREAVTSVPGGGIALRATVQGGINALLGGRFEDGAIAGFANGLADVLGQNLAEGLQTAAAGMSAEEVFAGRTLARIFTSAVRALGSPGDPGYSFANALVNEWMPRGTSDGGTSGSTSGAAIGLDGLLRPGVVDPLAPAEQQAVQLAAALQAQGMDGDVAAALAMQTIASSLSRASAGTSNASAAEGTAGPSGPVVGDTPPAIVITGRALPRDPLGNRYETDAAGNQVVHLAAGGMLALGASDAIRISDGIALPNLPGLTRLAQAALALGPLAVGALAAVTPTNAFQGPTAVALSETMRFEVRPGELFGKVYELQDDGEWLARAERYVGSASPAGFVVLDEAAAARWRAPITTPISTPPPRTTPPLLPDSGHSTRLPGHEASTDTAPPLGGFQSEDLSLDDLLIDKRNAEILGANLEKAGETRPEGYEAHHIVPSRAGGERMTQLRERLIGLGLTLNDSVNGVWLPGSDAPDGAPGAYHPRLNNRVYNSTIIRAFEGVTTLQQARDVLAGIAAKLELGDYPGVRPRTKP